MTECLSIAQHMVPLMLLLRGNTHFYSSNSHLESEVFCWSHLLYFYLCPHFAVPWGADLCTLAIPSLSLPSWWVQPMGSTEGRQNVRSGAFPGDSFLQGCPGLLRSAQGSHHTDFSFGILVTAPSPPPEAQGWSWFPSPVSSRPPCSWFH